MKETQWDKFNNLQKIQIKLGLKKGLDVSIYAKPKYFWLKMAIIREGLEKRLDVSVYAKPEF